LVVYQLPFQENYRGELSACTAGCLLVKTIDRLESDWLVDHRFQYDGGMGVRAKRERDAHTD